ncbi:MAG: hypothetical protein ACI9NN_001483, partial [Bacteroidia bacterium]
MKLGFSIFCFSIFVFLSLETFGQNTTDVVVLNNGDQLTVDVIGSTDSTMTIESSSLGRLTIPLSSVKAVYYNQQPGNYITKRKTSRMFTPKKWSKSMGASFSPAGSVFELSRFDSSKNRSASFSAGYYVFSNYAMEVIPVGLGTSHYLAGNHTPLFVYGNAGWMINTLSEPRYRPKQYYKFGLRLYVPNRRQSHRALAFDLGYFGGRFNREFINWQGQLVKRKVDLRRVNLGLG